MFVFRIYCTSTSRTSALNRLSVGNAHGGTSEPTAKRLRFSSHMRLSVATVHYVTNNEQWREMHRRSRNLRMRRIAAAVATTGSSAINISAESTLSGCGQASERECCGPADRYHRLLRVLSFSEKSRSITTAIWVRRRIQYQWS